MAPGSEGMYRANSDGCGGMGQRWPKEAGLGRGCSDSPGKSTGGMDWSWTGSWPLPHEAALHTHSLEGCQDGKGHQRAGWGDNTQGKAWPQVGVDPLRLRGSMGKIRLSPGRQTGQHSPGGVRVSRQLSSEHEGPWHCTVPACRADTESSPEPSPLSKLGYSADLKGLAGSRPGCPEARPGLG